MDDKVIKSLHYTDACVREALCLTRRLTRLISGDVAPGAIDTLFEIERELINALSEMQPVVGTKDEE